MSNTSLVVSADSAPDTEALIALVTNSVSSPITRALYRAALMDYFNWWERQGRPSFSRAAVHSYRVELECRGYAPSTMNQKLAAVRKLAAEAAGNGLLSSDVAAGISQVGGARMSGTRSGMWLEREQVEALLVVPSAMTLKGRRDRAILALLVGCGLRRCEAAALTIEHIQQRQGRWVISDLPGKHGRVRTVPVPSWVKAAVDVWVEAAGIRTGRLLRAVNRHGRLSGSSITPQAILDLVSCYGAKIGVAIRPHDLRRTCAKLCRTAGGDLEQIQLLMGHSCIATTERYLGTRQDLIHAPNDAVRIRVGG